MRRTNCPWCNQVVYDNGKDIIKCVNGRGMFKTEIYAHRSCYERMIRRCNDDRQKVSAHN